MKKLNLIALISVLFLSLLLLQNCKHDPGITKSTPNDPDSLYIGKVYTYPVVKVNGQLYGYRPFTYPSNYTMTLEGIQLGRMLFYDSSLALTHNLACGSCHKQQYAFGDNMPLSINVNGPTKRNTMALMNLAITPPTGMSNHYFWDGRKTTVEDAVRDAFEGEQHPNIGLSIAAIDSNPKYVALFKRAFGRPLTINEDNVVNAIGSFVRTLISTDSRFDKYCKGQIQLTSDESQGFQTFLDNNTGDCLHCHSDAPFLTFATQSVMFANNAIDAVPYVSLFPDRGLGAITGDTNDYGKFKIPTLRNVAVSAPYMHDGRFTTLDQVINHYSDDLRHSPNVSPGMTKIDSGGTHLDADHKRYLLAFLNSLTDTSYLHNSNFSNPFH